MPPEIVFSARLRDNPYEVRRTTFQVVRYRGGFNRLVSRERHAYFIDGVRTPKRIWLEAKEYARMTDEQRAQRDADIAVRAERIARINALILEYATKE
jgi:hypothetical protein